MQLTYDALKAVGFDSARMEALERERDFVRGVGPPDEARPGAVRRPQAAFLTAARRREVGERRSGWLVIQVFK